MGLLLYLIVVAIMALIMLWITIALVFFIAGRIVSGMNTTFRDALVVAFVGALVTTILQTLLDWVFTTFGPFTPWDTLLSFALAGFITLIVYIPLIMKFFDVGIGGAILVGLLAIVFTIIIGFIMIILIAVLAIVLLPLILLPGP
jgi:hypothetical protein